MTGPGEGGTFLLPCFWGRVEAGTWFLTLPLFGGSLNSPQASWWVRIFGVDSKSPCGCMSFFLAVESTISKERVVLNGLSCQARSSFVPGTSSRAMRKAEGGGGDWPLPASHCLCGLCSEGLKHEAALTQRHPTLLIVFFVPPRCDSPGSTARQSPLAVSAGWDFWFSSH